ncbi:MAG: DUF1192 domain-containing protein [Rhodospirillales bacterium]|nr:DUF1192 domain-containing protein [Rhodospirillales bacterium]
MDIDELEPRRKQPERKNLEPLSVAELKEYIADLEAEIARARQMIAAKEQGRQGAESLFRRS